MCKIVLKLQIDIYKQSEHRQALGINEEQSRMDNPDTQKHNTTQKTKTMSNTDPTKKWDGPRDSRRTSRFCLC